MLKKFEASASRYSGSKDEELISLFLIQKKIVCNQFVFLAV